jgi:DNA modification methylase
LPDGVDEDVRFGEALAAFFIDRLTQPGELVLDPFVGFGTTLLVAHRMGRQAVGIELIPERADYIRSQLYDAQVHTADARDLSALALPQADLVLTSPPYMTSTDHPQNPLNGYRTSDGDYTHYLVELSAVFAQVADVLAPGGHLVLNVANLHHNGRTTPLAWDLGRAVAEFLEFKQDVVVLDDTLPSWITQDYCLVFRRASG